MSPPLLAVHGLSFGYERDHPVLCEVDLELHAGRRLAVLGPNGGGKTTLFQLMVGMLAPDAGEIRLDGAPLRHTRRALTELRSQVQLVLQDPDDQLFAADVYADVSFGPVNLGLRTEQVRERVTQALQAMDIEELAERPTHLLSFGQRKRIAIAGAIAMRPRLLILDEPTAGLDPAGVEGLLATLAELHADGTTLLLSTHDVDLAYRWADEMALVAAGRIVTGAAATVLEDSGLLATARLQPAWAPTVHRLLDHSAELAGARPTTAVQLRALLTEPAAGATPSCR